MHATPDFLFDLPADTGPRDPDLAACRFVRLVILAGLLSPVLWACTVAKSAHSVAGETAAPISVTASK